jgi:hypothetical protein
MAKKRGKNFETFIEWFNKLRVGDRIASNEILSNAFHRKQNKPSYHDISSWLTILTSKTCIKSTKMYSDKSLIREKLHNYIPRKNGNSIDKKQTYKVSQTLIEVPKDHYEKLAKTVVDLTKITKLQQDEIKKLKETAVDPSWLEPMLNSLMQETGLHF